LNELSFRLGKAWAKKDWEHYGPVVTARALLSPQAAEPVEKETPMGGTSKDKVI
jgi:hypothetical protein